MYAPILVRYYHSLNWSKKQRPVQQSSEPQGATYVRNGSTTNDKN